LATPVWYRHTVHRNRPPSFIIETIGPIAEWLIDRLFLSSVIIAPVALIAAILSALNGSWLVALMCLAVAVFAGVGIRARFVTPFQLMVKRLEMKDLGLQSPSPNLQSLKVVFFSDLHAGKFKRREWVQRVVDTVNVQSPDLILIGGDFTGKTDCCELRELLEPLAHLRAPMGVFGVFGNHDHGIPGPDHSGELTDLLPKLGVRLMKNECAHLRDGTQLIGVEEIWTERADLHGALAQCADPTTRTLILGHNPDLLLRIDKEHPALNPQRTLFLFGHTHHGQIYLPFAPGLAVPIKSNYYRGIYRTPYGTAYVSSGVGENTTPTRINTKPEIIVLEF
jgi:predicted MPP superfamily phosphohydrolase